MANGSVELIPFEVAIAVEKQRFAFDIKPGQIYFFAKNELGKDRAWIAVGGRRDIENGRNPWRKCHTENYWVWIKRPEKAPPIPR